MWDCWVPARWLSPGRCSTSIRRLDLSLAPSVSDSNEDDNEDDEDEALDERTNG